MPESSKVYGAQYLCQSSCEEDGQHIYIYMYIMHEPMTINDYQCYECHINYTCWYNILFIDDADDDDDDEVDVHDPFEL